ncbi:esterase-like activity of phytase family protein [Sphingomonas colocasiae]|uniref:esterase-like activity of phytase family protein n=1 Tax=Sphingomonas colocasiae TaxID=1848973 RepID=UPI001FEA84BF|nr:esterase-like activity of phytase family protein [Sphingomonas colocasiae]
MGSDRPVPGFGWAGAVAPILILFFPGLAAGEEPVTRPNIDRTEGARTVSLNGRSFVNLGLVGAGRLPADTPDFLGDTLGSFSSLQVAPGSWARIGDHYEAILWTLPDRGRNDPDAKLFFDYPARLHRFRIRFTPADGRVSLVPDGGLELRDFRGRPFTGADPGAGTLKQRGMLLPAPAGGVGAGKVSLDAESLQFARDGSFYVGDEYTANIYYFDPRGRLRGVIRPPAAIVPRCDGRPYFGSLQPPETGRRNNQGVEGMSLSPDGRRLFVALQSALVQDSAAGNAAGRTATRVLVYDVGRTPVPVRPIAHHVVQLPAYDDAGGGGPPDRTAAQSEIRAIDDRSFLMLARDGAGRGAGGKAPIVYKSVLLVDLAGATNLAGSGYETGSASLLRDPAGTALRPGIVPAARVELVNLLNPAQLARFGLDIDALSEKWEALDLVPALDPDHPDDHFLIVGNDNDFIARHCRMSGRSCDSAIDNDSRILLYRLRLPRTAG